MRHHPANGSDSTLPYRGHGNRHGFTLIEIVIVMVIISMVMMLVIPRLPSSDEENLKISARTLVSTIRYLQERAATSRTGYYMTLAPGTESLKISEIAADGSGNEPSDPLLQKSPIKEGIIITDVVIPRIGKVTDGQLRVDVGMGGIRDFVTIHLRSAGGKFWTVMSFPSGGKVKAYEGYIEDPP
ncbi:MAG: prepilin-type N-terminal cleavage/methylation domain-containing protein [Desulfuromonadaceae bacterium]|nr:prepilin-type N-terminal cleavage/methylation domain-containing protein [Desulfuromonadaceae bacterium]